MTIGTRIKQARFASPEHEVFLALQHLVAALVQESSELLRSAGLSGAQYNVLRILRGGGDTGMACGEIADRLISRDPDMTRLLDKLDALGLIARSRENADRRVVTTRITDGGLAILADLDEPMNALHKSQLGHLGKAKLARLLELLDDAASHSSSETAK